MGQRSVRFPDELERGLLARAAELDRSFSWVVVRELEKALDGLGDGLPRAAVTDGSVASAAPVVRPAPPRASAAPLPSEVVEFEPRGGVPGPSLHPNAVPPVRFKTPRPKGG